jgi:hypothetical protein
MSLILLPFLMEWLLQIFFKCQFLPYFQWLLNASFLMISSWEKPESPHWEKYSRRQRAQQNMQVTYAPRLVPHILSSLYLDFSVSLSLCLSLFDSTRVWTQGLSLTLYHFSHTPNPFSYFSDRILCFYPRAGLGLWSSYLYLVVEITAVYRQASFFVEIEPW